MKALATSVGLLALLVTFGCGSAVAQQAKLDVRLGKPLMMAAEKQKVFVKVGLTGFDIERKNGARSAINVAIVLDKSGSMSGEKIRRAKEASLMAVDRLGPDDIVSIVAYDSTVQVLVPATKASDRAAIRAGIHRIGAGGNTALFAGVSKGADEVAKFLSRNRVNRVILLSDGLANVGPSSPTDLEALGYGLGKRGMSITTLGLGLDYNEDLMSRLSRASDGNHVFVEQASDLARFFTLEFGEAMAVSAQDVKVKIVCAPGVRPVRVLGRDAEIVGREVHARLNQLIAKHEKDLMLEVEVPAGEVGAAREIVKVDVVYSNMATSSSDTLSSTVRARFTADKSEISRRRDREVMVRAVQLVSNEQNRMALQLRDQGKQQQAQQILQDNAAWLDMNSVTYGSAKLKDLKRQNEEDARNLTPGKWKKRRKVMRREQHRMDALQSY